MNQKGKVWAKKSLFDPVMIPLATSPLFSVLVTLRRRNGIKPFFPNKKPFFGFFALVFEILTFKYISKPLFILYPAPIRLIGKALGS